MWPLNRNDGLIYIRSLPYSFLFQTLLVLDRFLENRNCEPRFLQRNRFIYCIKTTKDPESELERNRNHLSTKREIDTLDGRIPCELPSGIQGPPSPRPAEKREYLQSALDWMRKGVSDPGSFKLDHLQSVKLILSQKSSTFFTKPPKINHFLLPQREEGRKGQGLKMGKGNSSKVNDTKGFLTLGHSNRTNCSLLNWFCPKRIPPFY